MGGKTPRQVVILLIGLTTGSISESSLDQADGKGARAEPSITTVYGEDDRRETFEIQSLVAKQVAASVVLLADRESVESTDDGYFRLHSEPRSESLNLCPTERFYEQPRIGYC